MNKTFNMGSFHPAYPLLLSASEFKFMFLLLNVFHFYYKDIFNIARNEK